MPAAYATTLPGLINAVGSSAVGYPDVWIVGPYSYLARLPGIAVVHLAARRCWLVDYGSRATFLGWL